MNLILIILAFTGLIIGSILAFFTKEELVQGKNYFKFSKKIILLILIVLFLFKAFPNYLLVLVFFILGILIAFLFKKIYFYLGLGLFFSFFYSPNFLILILTLIFLFGLLQGSSLSFHFGYNKKRIFRVLIINLIFFLIPFLLIFFRTVQNYDYLFLVFSAGAILNLLRN